MIVKLAWRNIKRYLLENVICTFQMIAIYIAVIVMVSTITSRFALYNPIKEILHSNSDYFTIFMGINPITGTADLRKSTMDSFLKGSPTISGCYEPILGIPDKEGTLNYQAFDIRAYDDLWIQSYIPELDAGCWLDEESSECSYIPAVISSNTLYNLGDEFIMKNEGVDEIFHIKIVGILKNGAYILEPYIKEKELDYRYFYYPYFAEIETEIRMIIPLSFIEDSEVLFSAGHFLLTYEDNVSESERLYNRLLLQDCGYSIAASTEEIQNNSIKYIFSQCQNFSPVLLGVMMLVIVSIMSSNAISVKRNLKNYAIYYVCGRSWNYCILIHLVSFLLISLCALTISLVSIIFLKNVQCFSNFCISIGLWQVIVCVGLVAFFSLLSIYLPYKIIKKQTPNEILSNY